MIPGIPGDRSAHARGEWRITLLAGAATAALAVTVGGACAQAAGAIPASSAGPAPNNAGLFTSSPAAVTTGASAAIETRASSTAPGTPALTAACLASGDGYFRARVGGAIDATIDWPNSGTRCQGETKGVPPGVRLSFQRADGGKPNLLFVFGLTGIQEGKPARATGVNLTVILQGTDHIFGTLGDSRCTLDSLTQKPLPAAGSYRIEARGFCTQPAHAVRGDGDVLVSTFEFAAPVDYTSGATAAAAGAPAAE